MYQGCKVVTLVTLCHDEFLSRFLHPLKTSKLSNFVRA